MPIQRAESPTYQSYLLRLWRDNPLSPWRVALQSAPKEVRHFATLEDLWAFLQACLGGEHDDLPTPPTGDGADCAARSYSPPASAR